MTTAIRKAEIKRKTKETDIGLALELDSTGESHIQSGVPFLDHMLTLMAKHGRFQLALTCDGDVEIDDHHSVEDIGICMGKALRRCLGSKAGIARFGHAIIPMDDSLASAAVDLSGRSYFKIGGIELAGTVGGYHEELTAEFFRSLAANAELNLHIIVHYGENRHHIHEAIFKACGVALRAACAIDGTIAGIIPSTKGTM
ncbi:MAG TPA: imidazoleglycerol-phosphate dehydratase HisB [Spirochaetota bacterium]|nr:imidazoleglycerol-phosphate dehydratase HisB [Spirochaetota bacterium]HNT11079.1 imidazoleglycerol-phosphate dehydratase HisB [Spirochaetota bacterium]